MKISVLGIRGLPSTYSGLETIMSELAPRWVKKGHKVTVYCRKSLFNEQPSEWQGVQLVYLPSIENKFFSTLSHSFFATLHACFNDSNVVFVWNAANGPWGYILRIFGKRAIINVDGMEWLRPKWRGLGRIYFKFAAKLATRSFPIVVTDAEEMKRLYLKEFGINTKYIAYGANIEPSENPEILHCYGVKPQDYYLIASRLVPDNNADLIIKVFVRSNSKKHLVIAGGADYKGNKMERAFLKKLKELSNEKVKFLGHIDITSHIKELHHHCFAYIHGHEFGGINPSLLKALGFSNCILALNTPFNSEVLSSGRYGILFEKNEADLKLKINDLELHPEKAETYRQNATEPIKKRFNWDIIAEQYLQIFREVSESKERL